MKIIKNCKICKKEFKCFPWEDKRGRSMCSKKCRHAYQSVLWKTGVLKGHKNTMEIRQKLSKSLKGRTAWNKGLKKWWVTPTEFKKGENLGENNPNWKGDDVGYFALHSWIDREAGKAIVCQICGSTGGKKNGCHWANTSGKYRRDI